MPGNGRVGIKVMGGTAARVLSLDDILVNHAYCKRINHERHEAHEKRRH